MAILVVTFKRKGERTKSAAFPLPHETREGLVAFCNGRITIWAARLGRRNLVSAVLVFDEGCTHTFDIEELSK